jgi:1-deoxy-D-xylulose-5-phosphate synthase
MMFTATHQPHPTFIRYPRGPAEGVPLKEYPKLIEIGKAEVVRNFTGMGGRKIALFPLGNMNSLARLAAEKLMSEGDDVAIINPRFIKPLDVTTTEFFGRAADVVVTLEDHVLMAGYGSSVIELFSDKRITTPVVRIGWPDQFIEHATTVEDLREKYGLTVPVIVEKIRTVLAEESIERNPEIAIA